MTRESKAGLLMIVMLVGMFGFMVYKKMHQPLEAKAQQANSLTNAAPPPDETEEDDEQPAEKAPEFTGPSRVVAAASKPLPVEEELPRQRKNSISAPTENSKGRDEFLAANNDFAPPKNDANEFDTEDEPRQDKTEDEFTDPFQESPKAETAAKPKLPTQIPDDDGFGPSKAAAATTSKKAKTFSPPGNDFAETASFTQPETIKVTETKKPIQLPTNADADRDDPFSSPLEIVPEARPAKIEPAKPESEKRERVENRKNPFLAEEPKRVPTKAKGTTKVVEIETSSTRPKSESIEFDAPKSRHSKQPRQITVAQNEFEAPQTQTPGSVPDPESDPFAQEPPQKAQSFQEPARKNRDSFEERPDQLPAAAVEQPGFAPATRENPRRNTRPAPITRIDEDFTPRTAAPSLIGGETYQIEPNDNFWTISRKKYGTGRYFMALAQHNAQVIPDPQRMKPGVTVSTPSPDSLERTYPQLVPKAGPAATGGPIQTASAASVQVETDTAGSFFVSREGTPMYRVGKGDTLGAIAQRHLGRSSRYIQIFQLNREVLTDEKTLKIGMELRLPADASRVEVVGNGRTYR